MTDLSRVLDFLANWWNNSDVVTQVVLLGHYKAFITGVTAVVTFVIAILLFSFYREALKGEKWILCFSGAFLVFSVQYSLQAVTAWMSATFAVDNPTGWESFGAMGHCFGSPVNTLLLLAAARLLMDKSRPVPWWLLPIAGVALSFSLFPTVGKFEETLWTRLPDALFATVALIILAWALFTNIDPQWYRLSRNFDATEPSWANYWLHWRKRLFAIVVLFFVLFYALVNFGYALNPILAERSTGFDDYAIGPLEGYDTVIFAVAIPLKLFLFLAVFYLILRNVLFLSPQAMNRTLSGVRNEKLVYHSSQGIVKTIGKSLDADAVQLYFKLPGNVHRRRAIAWWCWQIESTGAVAKDRVRTSLPAESTLAGWVLRHGELLKRKRFEASGPAWDEPAENGTRVGNLGIRSAIAVPIVYHGSVVGGLSIGWKSTHTVTATAIQRVGLIAGQLAPVVESRRELSALYFLGLWFQRQEIVSPHQGEHEALRRLTEVILPTLSPAAMGIAVEVGFRASFAVGEGSGSPETRDRLINVDWAPEGGSLDCCEQRLREAALLGVGQDGSERHIEDLKIEGVGVGTLILLAHGPARSLARPSVVSDWLLRQTVAILLADAIFDATRVWLWSILNRLQSMLNEASASTISSWFEAIRQVAEEAGVAWVVAQLGSEHGHYGEDAPLEVVRELPEISESTAVSAGFYHFEMEYQREGAHHVIRLDLTNQAALFLGIPRKEFGIELRPNWPWRIFLERFALASEASLARMQIGLLREDELNRHGVMTASVITGSLIHQISNMAADLGSDVHGLEEAIEMNGVAEPISQRIDSLAHVVTELTQVTSAIRDVTNLDHSRPCCIFDAVSRSERLFGPRLNHKHIDFVAEVAKDLEVDLPVYVLALAMANLVSNSLQALVDSRAIAGRIEIVAEDLGGIIHCRVIDNGPGVDPKLRKKIFDLNVSTKPGSNGLGLYLARRTLQENGGDILLTESRPGHVEFTMVLPKG